MRDYEEYLEDYFEPRLEKLWKKYNKDLKALNNKKADIAALQAKKDAINTQDI